MIKNNFDFHTHTNRSDGKSAPRAVIRSAIKMGLDSIGLSDHAHTFFDTGYCMGPDELPGYYSDICALKPKYEKQIDLYCGVEYDIYSTGEYDFFDYVIGSVHYVKVGAEYVSVDNKADIIKNAVETYFGGDSIAFAEKYFEEVGEITERINCDIIGHFDLLTKFNEIARIFDVKDERYIAAWKSAADKLLKSGKIFEINTGAISRGYRTTPYPDFPIYDYLCDNGAKFILSSDSHHKDTLCYQFEKWLKYYQRNLVDFIPNKQ